MVEEPVDPGTPSGGSVIAESAGVRKPEDSGLSTLVVVVDDTEFGFCVFIKYCFLKVLSC